jgi:hypothetical protein
MPTRLRSIVVKLLPSEKSAKTLKVGDFNARIVGTIGIDPLRC